MRITDIRETSVALKSSLRNAVFDFSEMTTSVVAVITDVVRDGKPVVGYAFNSTGRYACGAQMRARFIPRILAAKPESLVERRGRQSRSGEDPRVHDAAREAGRAHRALDRDRHDRGRVWDAVAKIADKPLHRVLAERYSGGKVPDTVPCYVGGGWYQPGKGLKELQDEIRVAPRRGLPDHEDQGRRRDHPGGREAHRGGAEGRCRQRQPGGGRERRLRSRRARSPTRRRSRRSGCAGSRSRPIRSTFALLAEVAPIYDAPIGTGENLFSTQDVENLVRFGGLRADRDIIQIDVPQSYGIVQFSRTLAMLERRGWKRQSVFPHGGNQMTLAHRRRLRAGRLRSLSRTCSASSPASPTTRKSRTASSGSPTARASASRRRMRSTP